MEGPDVAMGRLGRMLALLPALIPCQVSILGAPSSVIPKTQRVQVVIPTQQLLKAPEENIRRSQVVQREQAIKFNGK